MSASPPSSSTSTSPLADLTPSEPPMCWAVRSPEAPLTRRLPSTRPARTSPLAVWIDASPVTCSAYASPEALSTSTRREAAVERRVGRGDLGVRGAVLRHPDGDGDGAVAAGASRSWSGVATVRVSPRSSARVSAASSADSGRPSKGWMSTSADDALLGDDLDAAGGDPHLDGDRAGYRELGHGGAPHGTRVGGSGAAVAGDAAGHAAPGRGGGAGWAAVHRGGDGSHEPRVHRDALVGGGPLDGVLELLRAGAA